MRALLFTFLFAACSNGSSGDVDAPKQPIDAAVDDTMIDGPETMRVLVINEVAPGEAPDWIEVVNVTSAVVQLSDFAYVDVKDDFAKMKPFPVMALPPGGYYTQDIDDAGSGFKLGGDEEVWIYRVSDHALSDGVDWDEGAAPTGMSYHRSPDKTGNFTTGTQSKGVANP